MSNDAPEPPVPLPKVAVIGTGGTLSAMGRHRLDLIDYGLGGHLQIDELVANLPELAEVAEVRTKLALEQGTSIQTLSNAQYAVTRRTSDLLQLSNRLVQTTLLLKASQADAREAHASLQSKAAQIAVLESQQGDVQRQLQIIPDLRRQLAEAKGLTSPVISERDSLAQENRRLSLELADNFRKLNDPAFLKLQLDRAQQDMETRIRLAKAGSVGKAERHA